MFIVWQTHGQPAELLRVGRKVKKKIKCTLVQALRLCTGRTAHRGRRGIALLYLDYGTRRGWGVRSRPGRSLPPEKTRYPLYRRLGGPQGRSGQVRKISPPLGFDPRTVQPVASRYTDNATRSTMLRKTFLLLSSRCNQCIIQSVASRQKKRQVYQNT